MVVCKKCKLYLSVRGNSGEVVKCKGPCEAYFHKKCARAIKCFTESEKCEDCTKGSSTQSPRISIDPAKVTTEGLLVELNKRLDVVFKMQKTLDDMSEAVDFYAEQYLELSKYKESSEKKMKAVEQKNIYLEKCNKALEERVVALENQSKEKNIEIVGLDMKEGENIHETVKIMARKLNIDYSSVQEIKRVGGRKPTDKERARPRPVLITLASRAARDQWLAKKKTRITNSEIFNNDNPQPIFINEDLSRHQRQLFWAARAELKPNFKFVWTNNGDILVRKNEDNRKVYVIRSAEDIEKLKKSSQE